MAYRAGTCFLFTKKGKNKIKNGFHYLCKDICWPQWPLYPSLYQLGPRKFPHEPLRLSQCHISIAWTFLWLEWKSARCHYCDALSLSVRALFYLWVRSDVTVSLYLIQGHSRTGHWDACAHCIVGLSSPRRAERKQFVSAPLHTDTGGYWPGTPRAISLINNHILAAMWLIHCPGVKKLVKMVNF